MATDADFSDALDDIFGEFTGTQGVESVTVGASSFSALRAKMRSAEELRESGNEEIYSFSIMIEGDVTASIKEGNEINFPSTHGIMRVGPVALGPMRSYTMIDIHDRYGAGRRTID